MDVGVERKSEQTLRHGDTFQPYCKLQKLGESVHVLVSHATSAKLMASPFLIGTTRQVPAIAHVTSALFAGSDPAGIVRVGTCVCVTGYSCLLVKRCLRQQKPCLSTMNFLNLMQFNFTCCEEIHIRKLA